jgi:hypothetical protein
MLNMADVGPGWEGRGIASGVPVRARCIRCLHGVAGRLLAVIALAVLPQVVLAPWFGYAHAAIGLDRDGGPYVPTPQPVVEAMLRMARVGPDDFVVDLGSGDGRVVVTAAREFRARALGVDVDQELVTRSAEAARAAGVATRAAFVVQDMFLAPVRDATVVTLYVLPNMMTRLRPKLLAELRPGSRIVSHDFLFEEWPPDASEVMDAPEKRPFNSEGKARLYLWIVPAAVGGAWEGRANDAVLRLSLEQNASALRGSVEWKGGRAPIAEAVVQGTDIRFEFESAGVRHSFSGRVSGDRLEGEVVVPGEARAVPWRVQRVRGR